jgi:hypothetical protein
VYFSSSFSSRSTLIASISHIYNCKPFCSCLCDYKSLLRSAKEDSHIYIFIKMIDLDTSCKHMGWNGNDSLEWQLGL